MPKKKEVTRFDDAETHFLRQRARESYHTAGEDFTRLMDIYKDAIMKRPQEECSAWAWYMLCTLDDLSKKERLWKEFSPPTQRRLRMLHRWLRRQRVTTFDAEVLYPIHWEDLAALLFFSMRPGVRIALPALTEEVWL